MSGIHLALLGMNFGPTETSVEYLVISGGGAGGAYAGGGQSGGGGAGGLIQSTETVTLGTSYSITIGAGGAGVASAASTNNGNTSTAFSQTPVGGGGGVALRVQHILRVNLVVPGVGQAPQALRLEVLELPGKVIKAAITT
jgi:hypothetical protein